MDTPSRPPPNRPAPSRPVLIHSGLSQALQTLWRGVLDLVYPACCTGCAAPLADSPLPLCPRCLLRLDRVTAGEVEARLARSAPAAVLDGGLALWHFDKGGLLQRIQHALKYGNRPALGLALGQLMAAAWQEQAWPAPDLVVPVPLHPVRRYERGYNQSALLARGIGEVLGRPSPEDVLTRARSTRSQTRLTREARWANVDGAFATGDVSALPGRRVLLVDDVLTTGATAAAAAHALKAAGAASAYLLTLALART